MKNKKILILIALVLMISLVGITYAFFEYYGVSADYVVSAGEVTLTFNEGTDTIDLTNIFPETKEEARDRDDNVITFTVSGVNTTENKDIWYEIMLNEGDEETGLTRFLPKELMFDLTEINPDGTKNLVVDNMNFSEFDDTRIWVNTILKENESTFTRTYELRMWLSDRVLISDTVEGADYTTSEFRQRYASVRVSVFGDFNEKSAPYNYLAKINTNAFAFWPTSIHNVKSNITQVNFVSLTQDEIDTRYEAATIKEDVSDTTKGGSVKAWLEPDTTDTTKYIMYVASDGIIYFPSDSTSMFYRFTNLKSVNFENINTSQVTKMGRMFSGCSSLISLSLDSFDTSNVTSMSGMFVNCKKLTSLDLSNFDTIQVTSMDEMFYMCSGLISINISSFDTSNVATFRGMFSDCSNLMRLDISNFETGNVTDMGSSSNAGGMFQNCKSLTELDLSSFDTSNVTNMYNLFSGCSSLTSIDVSGFDTGQVTTMQSMFSGCSSLTSIDVSGFDTGQVTTMASMFSGCSKLTNLDVSGFDTDQVTTMKSMFSGCSNLMNLDLDNFNTGNVTNMLAMFKGCSSLKKLNLSNFNIGNVTLMGDYSSSGGGMFENCINLTTIYANSDWNTGTVTNSARMFLGCTSLVGAVPYSSSKTDITMANPTTGYFTVKPTEETPAA